MKEITERLAARADPAYAVFAAKLAPTLAPERFLGVRVPALRAFAKEIIRTPLAEAFLCELPHPTYDENLLHAILLSQERDYPTAVERVMRFLPFVDNWAVCDTLNPKVFARHREELLPFVCAWIASSAVYTCRFGLDMLMTHYLDDAFDPSQHALAVAVKNEDYYVKMMVAWYFATALAKQWDATLPVLTEKRLGTWTHNKTIQKACESFRLTDAQKQYLRTLRREK